MRVIVSGRHMGLSEPLKEYCESKAERLVRFYDRIQSIEVVLDGHSGKHTAEMIVHSEGTEPFVAREEREDVYAAIDLLLDKIEAQLRKHKEKHRNRKHTSKSGLGEESA